MKESSLQDVMNRMARHLEDVCPDKHAPEGDPVNAAQGLMGRDAVLAELYKEYTEAKAMHRKLIKTNGANDPMTEIAGDRSDSARSAFETRLIELRQQTEGERFKAIERLKAMRAEVEALEESRMEASIKHDNAMRYYAANSQEKERAQRDRESDTGFYMLLAMYYAMRNTAERNRMMSAFRSVSLKDGEFNRYSAASAQ